MKYPNKHVVLGGFVFALVAAVLLFSTVPSSGRGSSQRVLPTDLSNSESQTDDDLQTPKTRPSSLEEVLQIATRARAEMARSLHSYTARFVKQEVDHSGLLGEQTEMLLKVQTRFRNGDESAGKRVYLRFLAPESVKGREVIWAEDLHDGKLLVHEAGLLGMAPIPPLDPNGFLAMRGQRYPISQIGIVRLVEKLIERGQEDLGNPDIDVTITQDFLFDDISADLIQVKRAKPSGKEGDFSLAEIVIDPTRQLIVRYRSFGWPESSEEVAPLQESYTYHDIQTNVDLTELDFDPKNPEYGYP
ncbi:DUF1571 domain-containing protein [Novipirellula caenicola]|uniref:DUF1571 domain-containing protein n=1 Tax=Novipirellula caenicola TaxID=1536901 RepID=A0ABP9VVR0_9BACT